MVEGIVGFVAEIVGQIFGALIGQVFGKHPRAVKAVGCVILLLLLASAIWLIVALS